MNDARETIQSMNLCGMHSGKRQLLEALQVMMDALEASERLKWIPVSERLPEEGQLVLCSVKKGESEHPIIISKYKPDEWWYHITAWMPLPEPYEEENNG